VDLLPVVVPRRPYEVKLPAELLYEINFNCSDDAAPVGDVRAAFRRYITARIAAHGTCAASQTGCIVDDVTAACVRRPRGGGGGGGGSSRHRRDRPRQRRRRRRRRRRRSRSSRRRRRRRKRHGGPASAAPTRPLLALRFSVATQLMGGGVGVGGGGSTAWPDDYHRAVYWLRAVYDDVEDQLSKDDFRLFLLLSLSVYTPGSIDHTG